MCIKQVVVCRRTVTWYAAVQLFHSDTPLCWCAVYTVSHTFPPHEIYVARLSQKLCFRCWTALDNVLDVMEGIMVLVLCEPIHFCEDMCLKRFSHFCPQLAWTLTSKLLCQFNTPDVGSYPVSLNIVSLFYFRVNSGQAQDRWMEYNAQCGLLGEGWLLTDG